MTSDKNTLSNRHGSAVITLPSDTEILVTRVFDAPAALIFKAWTTPELIKRWWGFDTSEWSASTVRSESSTRHIAWCRRRCTRASPTRGRSTP